jgi:fibronectin type 3 domain-containing protein
MYIATDNQLSYLCQGKPRFHYQPGVTKRTHARSLRAGSCLLFLLLGGVLFLAPTAAISSVGLTWTASPSTVTGYNIYRGGQSGGPYTKLNPSLATVTSYTDGTVQAGQAYYYVATAVDASGVESLYSNEAQVFVPNPTVSSQLTFSPTSINFGTVFTGSSGSQTVILTDTGSASVTVSGEAVTGTGFSTSGLSFPLTLAGGQSTSFNATFAPAGAGSATGSISLTSNASNSPTSLSLAGTGTTSSDSVALTWNASTSTVAGYNAYRGNQSGGPYTKLNSSLVTTTAYTDSAVQAGQTYFYVATAVTSSGAESVYSNEVQATVPSSSQLSVSPTSLSFGKVTLGSSSKQTITLTSSGTASVTISQAAITGTGFRISGLSLPLTLAAGQNATFKVTFAPTTTGSVTGSLSVVSNATNSPATVSLSGTGTTSSHSVALSWIASTSTVAGYNAYRGNQSGGPYTKLNSSLVTTTAYTDSTVQAGQTYFYVATAVTSSGVESVYSNAAQATLPSSSPLSVSPTSLNFGSITVGSSAPKTVTLTNSGRDPVTVSQANVTGTGFSISPALGRSRWPKRHFHSYVSSDCRRQRNGQPFSGKQRYQLSGPLTVTDTRTVAYR